MSRQEFDVALDAYTNALVVAAVEGGVRQSAEILDKKAQVARRQLLKLYRQACAGETPAVRALSQKNRELERRLVRVRRVVA